MKAKNMMMAVPWIILILVLWGIMSGCSIPTLYHAELAGHRQENLAEDMGMLRPKTPVVLPAPLTLDDAVNIGLQNNLDLRISRIMGDIANEDALSQKLKMLPQLNFNGNLSQSSVDTASDEDKISKTATLSMVWNVLDFGLSYIRARQSLMTKEIRRMERLRQAQVLASDICIAYWKAVLAEQSLEEIQKIEREVGNYKTKAEILVSQKRLDPIASKAIEKKIVELAITASDLQAEISSAKIELCQLMGVDPMTDVILKRESFQGQMNQLPEPESLEPRKLEMISLLNRPELFSADLDISVQQDEARAALISMFPGLHFDFATHYNANSYYENNFWFTWGAGITSSLLSMPSQYFNWKSQNKTTDMVKLRRLLLTSGVIVQAHIALHDYAVKTQQFRLYEDSFSIAKDLLDMSRERHELGLLSNWALTQRMLEEVVARLSRDRRIIDLFNAYNMLLVTLGLDYRRWEEHLPDIDENVLPTHIDSEDIYIEKDHIEEDRDMEDQNMEEDVPPSEIEDKDIGDFNLETGNLTPDHPNLICKYQASGIKFQI